MHLEDAIGGGETDAAAGGFGGEVEFEDAGQEFGWDAFAGVGDLDGGEVLVFFDDNAEFSSGGHGLHGVEEEVEEGLADEFRVDPDGDDLLGVFDEDLDVVFC